METKYCSKCQQFKPVNEFYRNNRGGCKKCVREYQKQYYLAHYAPPKAIPLPGGLKKCSECREVKSFGEFYRDKSSRDGYHHYCKICFDERKRIKSGKPKTNIKMSPKGFRRCAKCKLSKPLGEYETKKAANCHTCNDTRRQQLADKQLTSLDRRQAYQREWKKNPDYIAKQKSYRVGYNQREDVRAKNRKHNIEYRNRPENQKKARAKAIAWRKANLDKANHQSKIKYYRKKGAEGSHTLDQWLILLSFFDCCPKCGEDRILTRDHIIPLTAGGTNYIDNIQPLCRSCNSKKLNMTIVDYRPAHVRRWAFVEMSFVYQC